MNETIAERTRAHRWRIRLLAGWEARYLDTQTPAGAPLAVRRARIGAARRLSRDFACAIDGPDMERREWSDVAWAVHGLIREAFLRDDGVPFMTRFPLPTA